MYAQLVNLWLRYWAIALVCLLVIISQNVQAEKLTVELTPNSFTEVETAIEKISSNVSDAQCGGWDVSQSVGNTVGQGVARVTGVPGRKIQGGNPLNAINLGMALKDDAFYFPDEPTTCGFVTACLVHQGTSERARVPFLRETQAWQQCERPLDGYRDEFSDPSGRITNSCGQGRMQDVSSDTDFCPTLLANNPSINNPGNGFTRLPGDTTALTDTTAGGICQRLNEDWIYSLWRAQVFTTDAETGACVPLGWVYNRKECTTIRDDSISEEPDGDPPYGIDACPSSWELDSYRYCCTDQPLGSALKNCFACTGAECHTGLTATALVADEFYVPDPTASKPLNNAGPGVPNWERPIFSFFRHYLGSFQRNALETGDNTNAPNDGATIEATTVANDEFDDSERLNLPIPCYGYWVWQEDSSQDEEQVWNPENVWTPRSLLRCVISSYYPSGTPLGDKHFYKSDETDEDQMIATQAGKGSYFAINPETGEPYADPPVDDADRPDPTSDDDTTVWFKSLGRAFSLISKRIIDKEDFVFSEAMLTTDVALQRSTVQRFVPDKDKIADRIGASYRNAPNVLAEIKNITLSRGGLIRAFDEMTTSRNLRRPMVEWWQGIENAMNTYLTPPSIQLILPAAWSIDLDPLHPILTPSLPDTSDEQWRSNPEIQTINVQLELHEDLLGEVTSYLEDSLIVHYTPEPITVLVPSGSAKEYRALAQKWCSFAINEGLANDCGSVTGDIKTLIDQLLDYADRIEDSRQLRAQATVLQAKFLQLHTEIQQTIGQWVINNTQDFIQWRDGWNEREDIVPLWEFVQRELWSFTWETNQPWCMNQRFTLPIYSLLDQWYPYINESGAPYASGDGIPYKNLNEPNFPSFTELHDLRPQTSITFDASHISLGTGSFIIPVLSPLPIALNTLAVGSVGDEVPTLEPLPAIPDFTEEFAAFVPKVLSGGIVPIRLNDVLETETIEDPEDVLTEIYYMLYNMNNSYKEFWDLIMVDPDDVDDGTEEDCLAVNSGYCNHFEFDLHERLMRIGSRPNVLLQEDFINDAQFLNPVQDGPFACLDKNYDYRKDWVCLVLSPTKVLPTQGFGIQNFTSDQQETLINDLRIQSFEQTLQNGASSSNGLQYIVPKDSIVPSFNVQLPTILHSTGAVQSSSSPTAP